MADHIRTKEQFVTPPGDYTVVFRMAIDQTGHIKQTADDLRNLLFLSSQLTHTFPVSVLDDESSNRIFARFEGHEITEADLLQDSTTTLIRTLRQLQVDSELEAGVAPTYQVHPDDSHLPAEFSYLDNRTEEVLDIARDFEYEVPPALDMLDFELDLASHSTTEDS